MTLKELPEGRRFQLEGRKYVFMKVRHIGGFFPDTRPGANGSPIVNLDKGLVFVMKSDTPVLT